MLEIVDAYFGGDERRPLRLWIEMRRTCGEPIAGAFLWTLARAITTLSGGPVTPNPMLSMDRSETRRASAYRTAEQVLSL